MAKLKILRIISRLNVGGPAQHAILLTHYFNQLPQWDATLMSGIEDKTEKNMLYLAERYDVELIRIDAMKRRLFFFSDLVSLFKIMSAIRRTRPVIVHTHTAKAGALGRVAAKLLKVPVIVHTFHGHVFHGYFNRFLTSCFVLIERILAKSTDCIITLTETLKSELTNLKILGNKETKVVPLGLDLDRFKDIDLSGVEAKEALGFEEDDKVIGIVGRLVPIKRHEFLVDVFQRISAKNPNLKLLIVGGGICEAKLRAQVERLGLYEKVRFTGFRQDLERIYPAIDIVTLVSSNEGMPVCLIEAMACGCPIIATDVGGVRDLLFDYPSCNIIPCEDATRLAHALEEMLSNLRVHKDRAQAVRLAKIEKYTIQNLVKNLESLYQELLRRS